MGLYMLWFVFNLVIKDRAGADYKRGHSRAVCMMGNFACFLVVLCFSLQNWLFFQEYQDWIQVQVRPDILPAWSGSKLDAKVISSRQTLSLALRESSRYEEPFFKCLLLQFLHGYLIILSETKIFHVIHGKVDSFKCNSFIRLERVGCFTLVFLLPCLSSNVFSSQRHGFGLLSMFVEFLGHIHFFLNLYNLITGKRKKKHFKW